MSQKYGNGSERIEHSSGPQTPADSFGDVLCLIAELLNGASLTEQDTAAASALEAFAVRCGAETALVYEYDIAAQTASFVCAWPADFARRHRHFQIPLTSLPHHFCAAPQCTGAAVSALHHSSMRSAGILEIPLMAEGAAIGVCCFSGIPGGKRHRESIQGDFRLFGALLSGYLLRVRREQELSEERDSMRLLLDSTHDAIGMLDIEGVILNVNGEFAARFGKKPEELIGRHIEEAAQTPQNKDLFSRRRALIKSVFETKQPVMLEDCRDGRWFDNRFYPVYKRGRVAAVTIFSTDITERKHLEAEKKKRMAAQVKAGEQRKKDREYIQILDNAAEGGYVIDFEKNSAHCSQMWKNRLGLSEIPPEQLLDAFLSRISGSDPAEIYSQLTKACACRQPGYCTEFSLPDKDGHKVCVLVQGRLIYDEAGRLVKTYGTFIDITERKEMELALQRQAQALAEENRLVNHFFLNVSHEFRTPLSVLMMHLDMMDMHLDEARCEYSGGIRKAGSDMRANVYRLMHLVGNILDITLVEAGGDRAAFADEDIVALTGEIVEAVRSHMAGAGPDILFVPDVLSRRMPTDSEKLEKILLNLLSNAVKHSPPGGLIQVSLRNAGSSVLISVSDQGSGIPADVIGTVFDRFRRSGSFARPHEGCGIGLSLTRSLVELLGGRICAESRPGHGSRFFVELPAREPSAQPPRITQAGLTLEQRVAIAFADLRLSGASCAAPPSPEAQ